MGNTKYTLDYVSIERKFIRKIVKNKFVIEDHMKQ